MFSGILENQIILDGTLENVYQNLNGLLCRRLETQRTFVCFVMAEIDIRTHNMRLSNGACPYPYHFIAASGKVEELQTEAYPLGVDLNTNYEVIQRQLSPGDYLVFCSDGIIEAANAEEEPFGFDRVEQAIRDICKKEQSASAVIDHLLDEVSTFVHDQQPTDDMTCMVMHLET
jgi:serine phosphatase RsbU (regulator of sigma subunit)